MTLQSKPPEVRIYENANLIIPGSVYKIEYIDINDVIDLAWQGTDTTPCGGVFEPALSPTDTQAFGWEEMDAVELIGTVCE